MTNTYRYLQNAFYANGDTLVMYTEYHYLVPVILCNTALPDLATHVIKLIDFSINLLHVGKPLDTTAYNSRFYCSRAEIMFSKTLHTSDNAG